ncbi:MAG: acyl-CoA dehydrogenase [Gammaproteobacteria bacterium]
MPVLLEMLITIGIVGSLLFYRAAPFIWIPIIAAGLLGFSLYGGFLWWLLLPSWCVFLAIAFFLAFTGFRVRFVISPLMKYLRKLLPPMSETERVALTAGQVGWDGELFSGAPRWATWLRSPRTTLTKEEQHFLDHQVEQLCALIDDWHITHKQLDLSPEIWAYLKQEGFFALNIDPKFGGKGFSAIAQSAIVTKLASRSLSAAVDVMVPNSLGPAELIEKYGTEEQKKAFLPKLARGEEIPCFALTANDVGSDATAISDTGVVCKGHFNGKSMLGMRLNFKKRYITLAPKATLIALAFQMYDPDGLLGEKAHLGITVALVPAHLPGVTIGERHFPLNAAFLNGPITGKDVFLPLEWIVGGVAMAGQGWSMLMECLLVGRGISLPSLSGGAAQLCYRTSGAYARIREQFRLPIGYFEGVQEALARIGGFTYLIEACRTTTATAISQGERPGVITAIAKYHTTEFSRSVVNDAMDILGGRGIQLGPRNYLGRIYQGLPIAITVEGANILTRNLMIFGQGALRCHPYLQQEMAALENNDVAQLDNLLCRHVGYTLRNVARCITYALTGGRFIRVKIKRGPTKKFYRQLTRMSTALALVTDMTLLIVGGNLKRRERLSARLGDVLSHLYLASCALKFFNDNGCAKDELPYVKWAVRYSLHEIQKAFDEFCQNFPVGWVGRLMHLLIFPLDQAYKAPLDKLGQWVARHMLSPSALRTRLSKYCYVGKDPREPVARLEVALGKVIAAKPVEKKLQIAMRQRIIPVVGTLAERVQAAVSLKVITAEEGLLLQEADAARRDANAVDDFSEEELKP